MQHIGIRIENERGEILQDFSLNSNFANLFNKLEKYDRDFDQLRKKYPWFTSIDPFGVSVLNYLQLPYLTEELMDMKISVNTDDKDLFQDFINLFSQEIIRKEALLVKFIGD